jgi:hypothetical protein
MLSFIDLLQILNYLQNIEQEKTLQEILNRLERIEKCKKE